MGVSLWNFLIILTLYLFGSHIIGLESFDNYGAKINKGIPDEKCDFDKIAEVKKAKDLALMTKCKDYWEGQSKEKLFTVVLTTFVFLQVFNYFNCRKIGQHEYNVFEKIFHKFNPYFWLSIIFISGFQFVMVEILSPFTRTVSLNKSEWGACIITGTTVLPIAFFLKRTPKSWLTKIPMTDFIDEDKEIKDGLVDNITKYSNVQVNINTDVLKGKKGQQAAVTADEMKDDDYQSMN